MKYVPGVLFIGARNYTRRPGSNLPITRIVIHDMEAPEKSNTAEQCAGYFRTTSRQVSAHFCVDNTSVVQCVPLDRRAWHAPPNTGSIGIEHAGYARQTGDEWLDQYGEEMLTRSAALVAVLCRTFGIPTVRIGPDELRRGKRGICGHDDVSAAWHRTSHTDPGPGFPWDRYIGTVQRFYAGAADTEVRDQEDGMTPADVADIASAVWNRFTVTDPSGSEVGLVDVLERLVATQREMSTVLDEILRAVTEDESR